MNEKIRLMLNRYADICAVIPEVKKGIKLFECAIKERAEEGIAKEAYLGNAVRNLKEEYRKLVRKGVELKQKLLRVMSAESIARFCRAYTERVRAHQRRHNG